MNSYKIKYSNDAIKFLKKNKIIGIKFMKAFSDISNDYYSNLKYYDIKKIKDKKYNDIFRLRISKYRAIYRVIENEILIFVFVIDSRGDVYKNF